MKKNGTVISPKQLADLLRYFVQMNIEFVEQNQLNKRKAVAVWGPAGLGKTDICKQLKNYEFKLNDTSVTPEIIHLPISQIEETGDILGLPEKQDDCTVYLPPKWFPTEKNYTNKPVILIIDDFNRADPRILNAIMQLIQDKKSISAEMAKHVTIILTGNEYNSDEQYTVNDVDKAFMTRLFHTTLKFDPSEWAVWANNNKIDDRVISWVLAYPELVNGTNGRTNPRSVSDFGDVIKQLSTQQDKEQISIIASGYMDEEPTGNFLKFILGDFNKLVSPCEILNDWEGAKKKLSKLQKRITNNDQKDNKIRTDLMGVIAHRMYAYMMSQDLVLNDQQKDNFNKYILSENYIAKDLMYMLLRRLNSNSNPNKQQFLDSINNAGDALEKALEEVA